MRSWFRLGVVGMSLTALLVLPACYAEVAAPVAPPPAKVVVMPARPGFVWVDGHHEWRRGAWVFVPGHYSHTPRGHVWVPGRWVRM